VPRPNPNINPSPNRIRRRNDIKHIEKWDWAEGDIDTLRPA